MRIVDHQQEGCLRLALRDQAESGQADQEDIGRVALGDTERYVERLSLRIRTVCYPVEEWKQQLMEPSEGQPRLRLRTRRRHHRAASFAGALPDRLKQGRLTDSRDAANNQGIPTPPDPIGHSEEALQLLIAPQETSPG